MKTISHLLLITGLLCSGFAFTQNSIGFGYDAAGNRISRTIVYPVWGTLREEIQEETAEEPEEEPNKPAEYSEVLSDLIIRIYPNPTEGLIRIKIENLPVEIMANITLYQLSGKLITSKRNVTASTEIDITNQPAGIYLLRIVAGDKQTEWRIIKK
jgi:hypothetical protein